MLVFFPVSLHILETNSLQKKRILTNRLLVYSCGIKLPVIINTAEESSSESTNFTSARVIIKQSAIIFET